MGILVDHQIIKLCESGMISPFEPRQVKEVDGKKVISFGCSSMGYDLRVAEDFKVFTPTHSIVVDPKALDERVFVDVSADVRKQGYCLVPPNSFALCRSVERFKIPRDVLCIVLGKSTYARCFAGDTSVALVDGRSLLLEEMASDPNPEGGYWGYGALQDGRIVMTQLEAPRYVGRDVLLEIELSNGKRIRCTPDHEWLMRDGIYLPAAALRNGDSCMPLYRYPARGYEAVVHQDGSGFCLTHRLADEWNLRNGIYTAGSNEHRHHLDDNRRNNAPWNVGRRDAHQHLSEHNAKRNLDPEEHGRLVREALAELAKDPEWAARFSEAQSKKSKEHFARPGAREAHSVALKASWTPELRECARQRMAERMHAFTPEERSERMRQAWKNSDPGRRQRQADVLRSIVMRKDINEQKVRSALIRAGSVRGAARLLGCDRSVFRRFPDVMAEFKTRRTEGVRPGNHKVVSVRSLPGESDVFCLTAPATSNFALEDGVFVSNCGLIVNVTPLEPLWSGHVTIEISNTTPLPAKVYANEGIAQVLFFQADEVCETSYADKHSGGGKYQDQGPEIVLPRL